MEHYWELWKSALVCERSWHDYGGWKQNLSCELDTVLKNTIIPTMHQAHFHRGERKIYPVNSRKNWQI